MESARQIVITSISECFSTDAEDLNDETTALDVMGWDSFGHVQLMLTIEDKTNKTLDIGKTLDLKNVGELIRFVEGL